MFALFFVIIKFYKIKHKIFSITIERTITFNVSFSKLSRNILTFNFKFKGIAKKIKYQNIIFSTARWK